MKLLQNLIYFYFFFTNYYFFLDFYKISGFNFYLIVFITFNLEYRKFQMNCQKILIMTFSSVIVFF